MAKDFAGVGAKIGDAFGHMSAATDQATKAFDELGKVLGELAKTLPTRTPFDLDQALVDISPSLPGWELITFLNQTNNCQVIRLRNRHTGAAEMIEIEEEALAENPTEMMTKVLLWIHERVGFVPTPTVKFPPKKSTQVLGTVPQAHGAFPPSGAPKFPAVVKYESEPLPTIDRGARQIDLDE